MKKDLITTKQGHAEDKFLRQNSGGSGGNGPMPAAGGLPMIVREIVLTCSNPHVARAAVASIGGDFARRFSRDAASRNLSSGAPRLASRAPFRPARRRRRLGRRRRGDARRRPAHSFGLALHPGARPRAYRGWQAASGRLDPAPAIALLRRRMAQLRLTGLVQAPGAAHAERPCISGSTAEHRGLKPC